MYYVIYKSKANIDGVKQIPFKTVAAAEIKADNLFKQGYRFVKVMRVIEEVIYIPGGDNI